MRVGRIGQAVYLGPTLDTTLSPQACASLIWSIHVARRASGEPVPMTADYAQAVRQHRFDLLERNGALVALVETIPRADHLWVENLAVSPDHHGEGLGRAMLRRAEEVARELGHTGIKLATNQAFAGNLDFYRRAGFVVEREEPFQGGIGVYFTKAL